MDGVLCDWTAAACRAFGRDPEEVKAAWGEGYDICGELEITKADLWRRIDAIGIRFWEKLEPLPWWRDLIDLCESFAPVTILTTPSRHYSSVAGKLLWIQEHLPHYQRSYLMGENKAACGHPRAVLIDDMQKNVDAFAAVGGWSILFPAQWNAARGELEDPIEHVRKWLNEY